MNELTKMIPKSRSFDGYEEFLASIKTYAYEHDDNVLFRTDTKGIFQMFLDNLPEDKQHYNCHNCHRFVSKYGGLVRINSDNTTEPIMWPEVVPPYFQEAVSKVREYIKNAKIIGVYIPPTYRILGISDSNGFNHMSVENTLGRRAYAGINYTERYKYMCNLAKDYPIELLDEANKYIISGTLYRNDVVQNTLTVLINFYNSSAKLKGRERSMYIWKFCATSNAAMFHWKNGILGTLLDDIRNGLDSDEVIARFNSKTDPLNYMRPKAAPSVGNIVRAQELFAELGITENPMKRRLASLDDLQLIWIPTIKKEPQDGSSIFNTLMNEASRDLKFKPREDLVFDKGRMTWVKFESEILPMANSIVANVRLPGQTFASFTTSVYPDSKPIFKWDKENNRNPVAMYLKAKTMQDVHFNVLRSTPVPVTGICYDPESWTIDEARESSTLGVTLILYGAKDLGVLNGVTNGTGIFPEDLIPELHEVRSTIEAYSAHDKIEPIMDPACGVRIQKGINYEDRVSLTVYLNNGSAIRCSIDRFE